MNIYQKPAVLVPRSGTYLEPWQKFLQLLTAHRFCKKKKKYIKSLFHEITPMHQFKQKVRLYKKLEKPNQFISFSIFDSSQI